MPLQHVRTINLPRPHEQARSNHVRRLDPRLSAKRWAFSRRGKSTNACTNLLQHNITIACPLRVLQLLAAAPLAQVREPPIVKRALGTIRAGVKTALQRSCSSSSSSSSSPRIDLFGPGKTVATTAAVAFPPISPRDLLEGTCLRFETTNNRGIVGVDELRQVRAADVKPRLVSWSMTCCGVKTTLSPVPGWFSCHQFTRLLTHSPISLAYLLTHPLMRHGTRAMKNTTRSVPER